MKFECGRAFTVKSYIIEYLKALEKQMCSSEISTLKKCREEHLRFTVNIQHERLIHLMVMILVAVCFVISMLSAICFNKPVILIFCFVLLLLLVPYILHYYFLENTVQKLYRLDKILLDKISAEHGERCEKIHDN